MGAAAGAGAVGREEAAVPRDGDGLEALRRKLLWLIFFRLVTITILLGGTSIAAWTGAPELLTGGSLWALVAATYLASLVSAIVLRTGKGLRPLAYGQIALDVGLAAGVVAMTGYSESVFVFMFSLGIVNGSILLFRRGAVAAAALSLVVYQPLVLFADPMRPRWLVLFAHGAAFVATAGLSSYLAEQLRRTGERLQAHQGALAAITVLHEAIVHSVSSGIVTLDATARVTFLNRAGEQITGLRLGDIRGKPAAPWLAAIAEGGARDEAEIPNARGERLRIGFSVTPLAGPDGARLGSAIIFQDLTRLREMEEAMKRTERLADLGALTAGLAHELRNPLAAMMGSIELIRRSEALGAGEQRLTEIVLREAARLDHLVTRFLQFARPAAPNPEPVDLARLLRETAEVFSNHPAAAKVRVELDLSPAVASCDADQLRQVAWNLILNAAEAIGEAGATGTVRLRCSRAGEGQVVLEVEDDGPGIPELDQAKLFTPFFTRKRGGTGLGLAVVHRIVDAHGGTIEVTSTPGRGTAFRVRVPEHPASTG